MYALLVSVSNAEEKKAAISIRVFGLARYFNSLSAKIKAMKK